MKVSMKFKLLLLVIVGFLFGDVMRASNQPLLDNKDSDSMTIQKLGDIGDIKGQILLMREIAEKAEADFNKQCILHDGKISPIIEKLNKNRDNFLMNCNSTTGILKIEKDNYWYHDCPQCIFCCCACLFRSNYALAQHNVIQAIAFVEEDIKR